MERDITTLVRICVLPTSRRLFVFRRLLEQARMRRRTQLEQRIELALAHEERVYHEESRWRRRATPTQSVELRLYDRQLERRLRAFHDLLEARITFFGGESPVGELAIELRKALFPQGPAPLGGLSEVERYALIKDHVRRLSEGGDLASVVRELDLSPFVDQLAGLIGEAGQRFEQSEAPALSYQQLCELRALGQKHLVRIIFVILGSFPDEHEEHRCLRHLLLAPILEQDAVVRACYQARKPVSDIDPETGDEITRAASVQAGRLARHGCARACVFGGREESVAPEP